MPRQIKTSDKQWFLNIVEKISKKVLKLLESNPSQELIDWINGEFEHITKTLELIATPKEEESVPK